MDSVRNDIKQFGVRRDELLAIIDYFINELDSLVNSITRVGHGLSGISCELPKSAIQKPGMQGVKKTNKSPLVIESPIFSGLWNKLATFHFSCPPGILTLARSMKSSVIDQAKIIRNEYLQKCEQIASAMTNLEVLYQMKTEEISKASIVYQCFCKQVEDLKRKPEMAEKYSKMKIKFREANADMQAATRYYNKGLNDISTIIQRIVSDYEQLEKQIASKIEDLFKTLGKIMDEYSQEKTLANQQRGTLLCDTSIGQIDMENFLREKGVDPEANISAKCVVEFNPTQLPFEVFDYVDPRAYFGEELEWWGALTIEDTTAMGGSRIPKDTVVTVMKRMSDGSLLVRNESTGERDIVIAATSVQEIPAMKRCLFVVKEEHFDETWNWRVKRGEYVMGLMQQGTFWWCQNAYCGSGQAPIDKLERV